MQITRQADYAIRAVMYLANLPTNERASTVHIAEEQKIPPSFLAKIVSQLSVAGLLHTSRGAHGGVTLAKSAEEISLLDVIEAIDGPIALNVCVTEGVCALEDRCPMRAEWCDVQEDLINRLKVKKFAHFTPER